MVSAPRADGPASDGGGSGRGEFRMLEQTQAARVWGPAEGGNVRSRPARTSPRDDRAPGGGGPAPTLGGPAIAAGAHAGGSRGGSDIIPMSSPDAAPDALREPGRLAALVG